MTPRILVVSNTEFNLSDSNGRVLGTLLLSIPNDYKMQFCINGSSVSAELIENSFKISDKAILCGIFSRKIYSTKLPVRITSVQVPKKRKIIKRTSFFMLMRDIIWNYSMSRTDFMELAADFNPDIILWQYGDSGFMANLVCQLGEKCNAKIVVFTTEDYYFKTWDYFSKKKTSLCYKFFSNQMRKSVDKLFKKVSLCIGNTPIIEEQFRRQFACNTSVIMQPFNTICKEYRLPLERKENFVIYAGNLGIGRPESLAVLAKSLQAVAPEIVVEVYGSASEKVSSKLSNISCIKMMGFVDYRTIAMRTSQAMLAVHVESFDEFYRKDLQAAFSTKIPDILVSGTPLFMYAPENLAETIYLSGKKCAFICSKEEELQSILAEALFNNSARRAISEIAIKIAEDNHDAEKNCQRMLDCLYDI